ncbi:MAG: hypothetical protein CO129_03070 [Ignavibacteriales bacterium CG_4_9_14_3_um_filter_34_10]|nr:MAG: hypothetical protein CO129_03070 [Ignavibacteriales bacterium CG_4_9_14_3_um_filter_34_10]
MLTKSAILSFLLFAVFSTNIFAGSNNMRDIEQNLLAGLTSENEGLRLSCAYFLGEYKSESAVIPLMNALNTEDNICMRIIAALSLIKIGDERGVFLVQRTSVFDDCEVVRKISERFYLAYLHNKSNDDAVIENIFAKTD